MDARTEFMIPFSGLKEGFHEYEFELENEFFESFEYSEVKKGKVFVHVVMERKPRMLIFDFTISGSVRIPCDRCLEEYEQPLEGKERLIVKLDEDYDEESDDIIVIPDKEHRIDISHFLYEYVTLLLPYRRVHGVDEEGHSLCDPEVIRILNEHSAENETDPRWDELKKLRKKD